jgi:beta-N-acetylhexosaminidase
MSLSQASAVILAALEGVRLAPEEHRLFQDMPPAGFTLFRRNLSPRFSEIRDLCQELQALDADSPLPQLLAIDQEGGRVARLRTPFPNFGPAMDLVAGRTDQEALTDIENMAFVMGASLWKLGINVDFAPVVDVLTREENLAIGDRCFARNAADATVRAGAFLRGLQSAGVLGCLKHFPGQGDANVDTHEGGTLIAADMDLLEARELVPFRALLPEVPMIMISHAVYPALDAVGPRACRRQLCSIFSVASWVIGA